MTISDSSGRTSARGADTSRQAGDVTRSGSNSARYEAIDIGGGGGSTIDNSKVNTDHNVGNAFDGATATGESRPCAVIVWYEEFKTKEDERVCPECGPLDKKWFEVGKGPIPPLHDHCRCIRELVWWDCYQSDGTWQDGGRPQ
ncbi:MAG: hypothetical protein WBW04_20285 [Nitrolancea sp.]